jgi:hypothetical protein
MQQQQQVGQSSTGNSFQSSHYSQTPVVGDTTQNWFAFDDHPQYQPAYYIKSLIVNNDTIGISWIRYTDSLGGNHNQSVFGNMQTINFQEDERLVSFTVWIYNIPTVQLIYLHSIIIVTNKQRMQLGPDLPTDQRFLSATNLDVNGSKLVGFSGGYTGSYLSHLGLYISNEIDDLVITNVVYATGNLSTQAPKNTVIKSFDTVNTNNTPQTVSSNGKVSLLKILWDNTWHVRPGATVNVTAGYADIKHLNKIMMPSATYKYSSPKGVRPLSATKYSICLTVPPLSTLTTQLSCDVTTITIPFTCHVSAKYQRMNERVEFDNIAGTATFQYRSNLHMESSSKETHQ